MKAGDVRPHKHLMTWTKMKFITILDRELKFRVSN